MVASPFTFLDWQTTLRDVVVNRNGTYQSGWAIPYGIASRNMF
jgi:hypothetical protein